MLFFPAERRARHLYRFRCCLFSMQQAVNHARQVIKDLGAVWQITRGEGLLAIARPDQIRRCANLRRCLKVTQGIAHYRHTVQTDLETLPDSEQHAGMRLATVTLRFGSVRAVKDRINARAQCLR